MNKEKNKINLNINTLEYLKIKKYSGLKSKYAPLILNVIIANNNFPSILKDCIVDHNLIEAILLEPDFGFLINEFGKDITEFPFEFQDACNKLKNEFKLDYPKACEVDYTSKNKVYGKNYHSASQYFYHKSQFEEVKSQIRELILFFVTELGVVANLQFYEVYASCIRFEDKYKLRLEIYVREKNNFPKIFESKIFSKPLDLIDLKMIEQHYEWLAIAQKWKNEIDYDYILNGRNDIQKFIPDFNVTCPMFCIIK